MEWWEQISDIWMAGGTLMIPLALLSLVMYYALFEIWVYFGRNDYSQVDPNSWMHWIERPGEAKGPLGDIIRYAQDRVSSTHDVRSRVEEVRAAHLTRIGSRMRYAAILVGVAPLMGLLGTVVGMLATFQGLATSTGGQTVDIVAGGISEALITTQTGLIMAIPGYVFLTALRKRQKAFETFLLQVEITTLRHLERLQRI
ncbi:MAG: MotA/TolQ/ExbB proton channel family protein [Verrucomicrobiota bacterium]